MRRIDQMQEGLFPMAGLEKPDDVLIKTGSSWRSAHLYLWARITAQDAGQCTVHA
jgi:hypothetical protein